MAETPSKIHYPTNADTFDPAGDMESLARSVTHIVPVANVTERNAIANAFNPTPDRPLYVDRADTGTLERNNGSGWEVRSPAPAIAGRRYGNTATGSIANNDLRMYSAGPEYDYQGVMHSSTEAGGIRVVTPGWYVASAGFRWVSNSDGPRETQIRHNDVVVASQRGRAPSNGVLSVTAPPIRCIEGDEFYLWIW